VPSCPASYILFEAFSFFEAWKSNGIYKNKKLRMYTAK
jgi:hypothetical protein